MAAVTMQQRIFAFIRLGRPLFLVGGFLMHGLGVCAALWAGARLNLAALLLGQLAITATQWMVHYSNDYFDLHADRVNRTATLWSGGSRVLPGLELAPRVAYFTALVLALIAAAAGLALVLVAHAGPIAPLLIALTLFISWGYSAPPFQWHSRGIGEVVTALVVTVLTPALGFYLQSGYVPAWLLVVLWPLFCLQLCFQICINFPDAEGDSQAGKRTLVVRSRAVAARIYMIALCAAYAVVPIMLFGSLPRFLGPAVLGFAPVAGWLWWRARRGSLTDPRFWTAMGTTSIAAVLLTAGAQAAAFLLARG